MNDMNGNPVKQLHYANNLLALPDGYRYEEETN